MKYIKINTNMDMITSLPTHPIKYDSIAINKVKDIFIPKEIPNDYFSIQEIVTITKQHKNTILNKIHLLKKQNKVKIISGPSRKNKSRKTVYYKFLI